MGKGFASTVIVLLAVSDRSIREIKERLEELKRNVEGDREFWSEFLEAEG